MITLKALVNRIVKHKGREYRLKREEEAPQMPTELRRLLVDVGRLEKPIESKTGKIQKLLMKEEESDGTTASE